MNDHELRAIQEALEAAYDTLKQPTNAYLDSSDFEADREEAVEKLIRIMKIMNLDPRLVPTGLTIRSDCPGSVSIISEN